MASYRVLFIDKSGTGITGKELNGSIPDYTVKLIFYNSGLEFYDFQGTNIGNVSWNNIYQGSGVESIICNNSSVGNDLSSGEEVDYNGGDLEITVCYEYTPSGNQGGGNNGGNNGDGDPVNPTPETPLPFGFTVKSYKSGTTTEVADDFAVETCYYVYRHDEGTVGNYGKVYLTYYTGYDNPGNGYIYTDPQTKEIHSTITGYKLSGFHGLENNEDENNIQYYITGSKDGPNDYTFEAYYIDNDFTVKIDAKGIEINQVTVQDPNHPTIKYDLPYEEKLPNQALLLEAISNNDDYVFDYWEVNGIKMYNSILRYEIESDLQIYCCFKEKITPDDIEDDKIATNDDIHTIIENSSLYPITDDENSNYLSYRCPTKYDILNNNYNLSTSLTTNAGQLINIKSDYTDDQCVKFEDISFNSRKIKIRLYNDATDGVGNLGSTIVTFYASGDTLNSISTGDIALTSINISDYVDQTGGRFDKGDSIDVEYTLPNYNIFNMYIKIKIRGSYGAKNAFRTCCSNNSTINWMDQSRNELPSGTHDTVKGYSRKYDYFIKIIDNAEPNLCVVFYDTP